MLRLSDDELWLALGRSLGTRQAVPRSVEELIEEAKAWWKANLPSIQAELQRHPRLRAVLARDPSEVDDVLIVSMILDALSGMTFSVSPFALSVIIARYGVKTLIGPPP